MSKWNKEKITETILNYIKENNKIPSLNELNTIKELPSESTVRRYIKDYHKLIHTFYPDAELNNVNLKYSLCSTEQMVNDFKKEFVRLGCPSEREYNLNRQSIYPSTKTVLRRLQFKKYGELLLLCGFGEVVNNTTVVLHKYKKNKYQNTHPKVEISEMSSEYYKYATDIINKVLNEL